MGSESDNDDKDYKAPAHIKKATKKQGKGGKKKGGKKKKIPKKKNVKKVKGQCLKCGKKKNLDVCEGCDYDFHR